MIKKLAFIEILIKMMITIIVYLISRHFLQSSQHYLKVDY